MAIIGGGIMGCATALHLARTGLSVVVIEKGLCGGQASGVNMGGVRQQGRTLAELPIAARSRALWGRLPELIGEDCEFRVTGHLKLAWNDDHVRELETYQTRAATHGLQLEMISANALRQRYPWLSTKPVAGSLAPNDGDANPRLVAPAFARAAKKAGARIIEQCRVSSAALDGNSFETVCDRLVVRSKHLVNVAGAWGGEIARMFGEPVPIDLRLPNLLVTEPLPLIMDVVLGSCDAFIAARQVERGNIVMGGGGAGWGDLVAERSRPQADTIAIALSRLGYTIPAAKKALAIRSWSGLEGRMPDSIPVIGVSPKTSNLLHAFAFCGHGFQLGPGVGAILAEIITTGETTTPIEAFDIGRFSDAESKAVAETTH
ncbi:NAD(P)/FAD-dependent oxidoreductase [Chelatococcus asaccharovorans]|uniref:NAD(P)/FAD-dependent oxidoreductase n=1 Tax=Chelatococcus asaccharovorans TaxID=28210 RepID=UPI001AECE635|nr:FAD-binding oxidoreductase [Chelatococcus asaccharovorans]